LALFVGLGIILLSHSDTLPFWRLGEQIDYADNGGIAPFNTSLIPDLDINDFFIAWTSSPLADPFNAYPISAISSGCAGNYCLSYFLPGTLFNEAVQWTNTTVGDSVVLYDILGYQLEFYPNSSTDPIFDLQNDCKFYNYTDTEPGVGICLKNVENDILLGIAPEAVSNGGRCGATNGRYLYWRLVRWLRGVPNFRRSNSLHIKVHHNRTNVHHDLFC